MSSMIVTRRTYLLLKSNKVLAQGVRCLSVLSTSSGKFKDLERLEKKENIMHVSSRRAPV